MANLVLSLKIITRGNYLMAFHVGDPVRVITSDGDIIEGIILRPWAYGYWVANAEGIGNFADDQIELIETPEKPSDSHDAWFDIERTADD